MARPVTSEDATRKRVVYLLPGFGVGGGVNVVFEHAERLAARGVDVLVLSTGDKALDWRTARGVGVGSLQSLDDLRVAFDEPPDVLVATGWQTVYEIYARRLPAARYVYFVQSLEDRFYPTEPLFSSLARRTYDAPFEFVTEARWIQSVLGESGNDALYVPNGLHERFLTPTQPLSPKGGRLRVMIEGPLGIPFKRVREAFLAVDGLDVETWFVTGGAGELEPWQRPDRMFRKIPFALMPVLYASCDVLLKLSSVEGVFGPPLEMMAQGGVPVTSDVTGHDEFMVDGVNGFVVAGGRWQDARGRIVQLEQDRGLLATLAEGARVTAQGHRWDSTIEALDRFYAQPPSPRPRPEWSTFDVEAALYFQLHHGFLDTSQISIGRQLGRREPAVLSASTQWQVLAASGWVAGHDADHVKSLTCEPPATLVHQGFQDRSDVAANVRGVESATGFWLLCLAPVSWHGQLEIVTSSGDHRALSLAHESAWRHMRDFNIDGTRAWRTSQLQVTGFEGPTTLVLETEGDGPPPEVLHLREGVARRIMMTRETDHDSGATRWAAMDMAFQSASAAGDGILIASHPEVEVSAHWRVRP